MKVYFGGKFKYKNLDNFNEAFLLDCRSNLFGKYRDQSTLIGTGERFIYKDVEYVGPFFLFMKMQIKKPMLKR